MTHPIEQAADAVERELADLRAKLAVAVEALDATRIVLAEHEPHPLPVLSQVLAALAQIKEDE